MNPIKFTFSPKHPISGERTVCLTFVCVFTSKVAFLEDGVSLLRLGPITVIVSSNKYVSFFDSTQTFFVVTKKRRLLSKLKNMTALLCKMLLEEG